MDMGLIETYGDRMNTLSYQQCVPFRASRPGRTSLTPALPVLLRSPSYPADNCNAKPDTYPQEVFPEFLNHTLALSLTGTYQDALNQAINAGLETTMLETNTASCSGFDGLSNSFGGALWLLDWTLTQAAINFTSSYMHVGGRNAHYNVGPSPLLPSRAPR